MNCLYCLFYQDSPTRVEGQRFCNHIQKMVARDWEICADGFEVGRFFWCKKTEQTIDMDVCPARQNRGMQECTHCRQKLEILEVRKYMGRKNGNGNGKKIIKKQTLEETELHIEKVREEAMREEEEVNTLLEETEKNSTPLKPKIILHKRIKEEDLPKKKLIKKK
jgi:hypothetical protein